VSGSRSTRVVLFLSRFVFISLSLTFSLGSFVRPSFLNRRQTNELYSQDLAALLGLTECKVLSSPLLFSPPILPSFSLVNAKKEKKTHSLLSSSPLLSPPLSIFPSFVRFIPSSPSSPSRKPHHPPLPLPLPNPSPPNPPLPIRKPPPHQQRLPRNQNHLPSFRTQPSSFNPLHPSNLARVSTRGVFRLSFLGVFFDASIHC